MDTYSVNIFANDCCSTKCHTNNISTTKIFNSASDFICLQNGFYLKILSVTDTFVIVAITNGNIFFVRQLFINVCLKISLPTSCACHILSIKVNSIERITS